MPNHTKLPSVQVLLATYDGAAFLQAQLDSLAAQTFRPFEVLVADDGSTDRTLDILSHWAATDASATGVNVRFLDTGHPRSAKRNFEGLMKHATADYIFLCDQDDVWHSTKIHRYVDFATSAGVRGEDEVLIFGDAIVVDDRLEKLHSSLLSRQRRDPSMLSLGRLLVENPCSGNTLLATRALVARALPIPPEAIMHDWWLALVAATHHGVIFFPEALTLYRQHDANVEGAKSGPFRRILQEVRPILKSRRGRLDAKVSQARALSEHVKDTTGADAARVLVEARSQRIVRRQLALRRAGIRHASRIRSLALLALI